MTNSAAMTALQTLKATNKALDTTQGRISTGYRVAEAADNAAYWSIATTMRSDNKAMSTVQDALGLGAAQVDVAYTAMDAVKDSLDEIKAKLVAASQPNIDKAKIQEEIVQLQNDLKTFAKSATFSGGNWLDVNEHSIQKVVASFIREESGAITLGTIDIDTRKVALFTGDNSGLLQGTINLTVAGEEGEATPIDVAALGTPAGVTGDSGTSTPASATITDFGGITWEEGDTFTFSIALNGGAAEEITVTAGAGGVIDATAFNDALTAASIAGVTVGIAGGTVTFTGAANDGDTIALSGLSASRPGEAAGPAGEPVEGVSDINPDGAVAVAAGDDEDYTFAGFADVEWEAGDTFSFTVDLGGTEIAVTGTFDGDAWAWDHDALPADVEFTFSFDPDGDLVLNIDNGTAGSLNVAVDGLASARAAEGLNVTNFDITQLDRDQIELLINHVDTVLSRVTTAASDLGAIKSRVSSQASFVSNLMDAVNRGVGQLVDADMTEESTRLQALQVQQQLGIQALTIANGNSQSILALFRG